jgi:hypothetical protein
MPRDALLRVRDMQSMGHRVTLVPPSALLSRFVRESHWRTRQLHRFVPKLAMLIATAKTTSQNLPLGRIQTTLLRLRLAVCLDNLVLGIEVFTDIRRNHPSLRTNIKGASKPVSSN